MITCARTVALLSRQRADGGDLIGITRMPATGTSALVVPSLARPSHDRRGVPEGTPQEGGASTPLAAPGSFAAAAIATPTAS